MDIDHQPLLLDEELPSKQESGVGVSIFAGGTKSSTRTLSKRNKLTTRLLYSWLPLVAVFILVYFAGVATAIFMTRASSCHYAAAPLSYSPANHVVKWQRQRIHATDHNSYTEYSGPPSPEQDRAWTDLTRPVLIRASREDMELSGQNPDQSVELATGGYLAALGVYHELHCLRQRKIRWYIYRDIYYPNITDKAEEYLKGHIDHCLETLRLSSMCKGDIGLYTFEWKSTNDTKPATKSSSERECVNWDPIANWAKQRAVGWDPRLIAPVETAFEPK